jgi:RimJ/RimL family protein N-acetyltransferase
MTVELPPWPVAAPAHGSVVLREFRPSDTALAVEMGEDPYVPLIGTLPAHPTPQQALEWVERQTGRHAEGRGFSFAIADRDTDRALGGIGLWLANLAAGRASAGYSVSPLHRGRGVATDALRALTGFAWSIPELHRIELAVEPWNTGSIRVAEGAGYEHEGMLRSYQEIGGTRRDMLLYSMIRRAHDPSDAGGPTP